MSYFIVDILIVGILTSISRILFIVWLSMTISFIIAMPDYDELFNASFTPVITVRVALTRASTKHPITIAEVYSKVRIRRVRFPVNNTFFAVFVNVASICKK